MADTIYSKNGDKVLLGLAPSGVSVAIIPETPPKPDALDVFTLEIRFTNVARIAAMLQQGGTYTAARGGSTITTVDGEYIIRMPFEHDTRSLFTVVLDRANSEALSQFLQDALAGGTSLRDEDGLSSADGATPRVGRNEPCPCGSGKKYKRCCITTEPQPLVANPRLIPPELRPLAESHDPLCRAYVTDYGANPELKHEPEFWHGAGIAIGTHGQPHAALACLERARRLGHPSDVLLVNLAATLAVCGKSGEALAILENVSCAANRRAIIRANILQDLERHEEAIAEYLQAIDEEPGFFLSYARLLNSLKAIGSPLYEYWLRRAVDAIPKSPQVAQYFVRYCRENKLIDELADADWIERLEADVGQLDLFGRGRDQPEIIVACQVSYWAAKALRDRSTDHLGRAVEVLNALPRNSQLCDAGRFIAEVAALLGSPEDVRAGWNRICAHCVTHKIGLPHSGIVGYQVIAHMNCGQADQAASLCEQAGGAEADDPLILRSYWWALDDTGRTREAIAVAERLVSLGETESPLYYNLGYLCGKEGAFGKSRHYYQKEVDQSPTNFMAWENLSFVHLLAAQVPDADRCYREYQRLRDEDCAFHHDGAPWERDASALDVPVDSEALAIDALRKHAKSKDIKFDELVQQANRTVGSMSYALDLIAANNATSPIVGSFTTVKPVVLSPAQILANLAGGAACAEELLFHVTSQQREDASTVLAAVERYFTEWRALPEAARRALVEAERLFQQGTSIDFSPAIVSYAKTFEICLYEHVFKSFKERSGADFRIEQHVKATLADPQSKAMRLARFVEAGHALELGTMTFLLQLCTGRTCEHTPLLAALRDHIVVQLDAPGLLDKDYLAAAGLLVSRFRNKAAHEKTFDKEACDEAREIVYRMLNGTSAIKLSDHVSSSVDGR